MEREDRGIVGSRLRNAYLSSVISISLVLLLVGIASLLLVNAGSVSDYFKENMQISVMLKQDVSERAARDYQLALGSSRFIKSTEFISVEQGEAEMAAMLGEDFLDVFESSPISLVLGVFIILLLFVSFVLINNTIRLNVYARRFTIHTMKLVGATRSFIRAPFLVQAVFQGVFSAMIAILGLIGLLFFIRSEISQLFEIFSFDLLLVVMGIVLASGLLICLVSTWLVVNRLISLDKDDLYY